MSNMDPQKFLFFSWSGLIGDIAWQIQKEGHQVKYYIDVESERVIGDGFALVRARFESAVWPTCLVHGWPIACVARGHRRAVR